MIAIVVPLTTTSLPGDRACCKVAGEVPPACAVIADRYLDRAPGDETIAHQ